MSSNPSSPGIRGAKKRISGPQASHSHSQKRQKVAELKQVDIRDAFATNTFKPAPTETETFIETSEDASPSPDSLPTLLDFADMETQEDIAQRIANIAKLLLCHCVIGINTPAADGPGVEYEFLEVEFYLQKSPHHCDPFTHAAEEQQFSGCWYFHRVPSRFSSSSSATLVSSAGGYRGGSRKGVDLTMGGPLRSPYLRGQARTSIPATRGGILIRSLRRVNDGTVISGPSLVVDEMLRVCGAQSVAEMVQDKMRSLFAFPNTTAASRNEFTFTVKPKRDSRREKLTVYSSPRIGLDLSHESTTTSLTDPRVIFVQKLYRFFTNPQLLTANGRAQTFVGIYRYLSDPIRSTLKVNSNAFCEELSRITGLKRNTVDKYNDELKWGREHGHLKSFIGPAGKGASSSPSTYLKMMGLLSQSS